jgi:hypothetical protein
MRIAHAALTAFLMLGVAMSPLIVEPRAQTSGSAMDLARSGLLECEAPNAAAHTCRGMSRYVFNADGSVDVFAEQVISPSEHINSLFHQRLSQSGGSFCGAVNDALFDTAMVTVRSAPASEDLTARVRAFLKQNALHGQQCESYQAEGAGFLARISIDGVDQPQFAHPVVFVGSTDGYRVDGP